MTNYLNTEINRLHDFEQRGIAFVGHARIMAPTL